MPDDPITLDDLMGAMIALDKKLDARMDKADEELQAIRDVVDHELAGQRQVNQLEQGQRDVLRLLRAQGKDLRGIKERLDRAKV